MWGVMKADVAPQSGPSQHQNSAMDYLSQAAKLDKIGEQGKTTDPVDKTEMPYRQRMETDMTDLALETQKKQVFEQLTQFVNATNSVPAANSEFDQQIKQSLYAIEVASIENNAAKGVFRENYKTMEAERTAINNSPYSSAGRVAVRSVNGVALPILDENKRYMDQIKMIDYGHKISSRDSKGNPVSFPGVGVINFTGAYDRYIDGILNKAAGSDQTSLENNTDPTLRAINTIKHSDNKEAVELAMQSILSNMGNKELTDVQSKFYEAVRDGGILTNGQGVIRYRMPSLDPKKTYGADREQVMSAEETAIIKKVNNDEVLTGEETRKLRYMQDQFTKDLLIMKTIPRIEVSETKGSGSGAGTGTVKPGPNDDVSLKPWSRFNAGYSTINESFALTRLDPDTTHQQTETRFARQWQEYSKQVYASGDYKAALKEGKQDDIEKREKIRLADKMGIKGKDLDNILTVNYNPRDTTPTQRFDFGMTDYENSTFRGLNIENANIWGIGSNKLESLSSKEFSHEPLVVNVTNGYIVGNIFGDKAPDRLVYAEVLTHIDDLKNYSITIKEGNKAIEKTYKTIEDTKINNGLIRKLSGKDDKLLDPATQMTLLRSLPGSNITKGKSLIETINDDHKKWRIVRVYIASPEHVMNSVAKENPTLKIDDDKFAGQTGVAAKVKTINP